MALYSVKGRIYIDENDEIYLCQRPLQEDDETLGRRMQEKVTASQVAKLYPRQDPDSPRRTALIISHTAPFIPVSKRRIDQISARLCRSSTFAAKMRSSDAPPETTSKTCPKRTNSDINKPTPASPRPAKSLLKKPLRTEPVKPHSSKDRENNSKKNLSNNKTGDQKSQNNMKKNVMFDNSKSNPSETSKPPTNTTAKASGKKPGGDFLRLLLEET